MPHAIHSPPDDLVDDSGRNTHDQEPDFVSQLHWLLEEQSQHLDRLRGAIARIGQSLAELDAEGQGGSDLRTLKAQAEAIQGLTLLAIKNQHLHSLAAAALERFPQPPSSSAEPRWIYSLVGLSVVLSLLAVLF